jgi:CBS domain-containing protein
MPSSRPQELMVGRVMQRAVLVLSPEMAIRDALDRLVEWRVTGAPVVDEADHVVGVLSQWDLLRYEQHAPPPRPAVPSYYQQLNGEVLVSRMEVPEDSTQRVRDVMTPAVFMTDEATPVRAAGRFMLRKRVHRVLVTRRGKLVGIVTTMDLLRALLRLSKPAARRRRLAKTTSGHGTRQRRLI